MYEYFQISQEDLGKDAKIPLVKLGDSGEVFYEMALEMVNTIKEHNARGEKTVFICPVGPVGQYPIFVRLVNRDRVSLKNCWFFNMDEYLNDDETYIDFESPLSFHGFMNRTVYSQIDPELVGEVLDVIKKVAAQGYTMLLVSHEMNFIRHVSNRVIFLDKGHVVEDGTPKEVFEHPQNQRTREFFSKMHIMAQPEYVI